MLNNESEEKEVQPNTDELLKRELAEHPEILEVVEERKRRRFTWSGLLLVVIGVALIATGLLINTGVNSIEGWIVGVGALVLLVGILRILIGLINPILPSQL
jgi:hypothetical protein